MTPEEAKEKIKIWIESLIDKELQYISGRNFIVIKNVDWNDGGKLEVARGDERFVIRYGRLELVIKKLLQGNMVHVDTVLRSGSNDRSAIETILANLPPIGFMKPNQGRNNSKNKVIQWLNEDIHAPGEIKDISDEQFNNHSLYSHNLITIQNLYKPFILLAGISGTGKTRFVREQAKLTGDISETYCLVSVRPDWHEPGDLLGYASRLGARPQYIATDVLRFIVKAWREIIISIEMEKGKPVDWKGHDLEQIRPFWLCLDEMNLAPVEQYFADYLSILETSCWNDSEKLADSDHDYIYECDPLIKGEVFTALDIDIPEEDEKPSDLLAKDLGLNLSEKLDKDIWDYFLCHGISIPFNLIVAGTVNMDETTHGFSRKVIDRALTFDFGEFFPNNFDEFFEPATVNKALSYPVLSHAKMEMLPTIDSDGSKTIAFLNTVNDVLDNTPFKLAFRALNELLLAVISQKPQDNLALKAVWDNFLMSKVLPRIEGDNDKLASGNSGNIEESILAKLSRRLEDEFSEFWNEDAGSDNARPDLFREKTSGEDRTIRIPCRSKAKIEWMQNRLVKSGFTSFWP